MNSHWEKVRLAEVLHHVPRPVDVNPAAKYREIGIRSHGKGVFHKEPVSGLDLGAKRVFHVAPGDFVLNIVFAWEGAVAVLGQAEQDMIGSHRFPTFRCDEERLSSQFLLAYLNTPAGLDLLGRVSPGGAGRNRTLSRNAFLQQSIPLPPIAEQRRIVEKIRGLSATIGAGRKLRQETVRDVDALVAAEETGIWPTKDLVGTPTLEDVTTFLSRGRQTKQGTSGHYLIKTQHVQMGRYVGSTITLSPEAASKVSDEATARPGDILIACSAAGCLGRVAFYSDDKKRASTDSHVAIARPNRAAVSPEYLYAYLRGAQGQLQLRSREKGDWKREKVGFRLTELNVADMRRVPVPVPSPAEQCRIVDYVESVRSKVDRMRQLQAGTAVELDALLPAILNRAFRGEL